MKSSVLLVVCGVLLGVCVALACPHLHHKHCEASKSAVVLPSETPTAKAVK